MGRPSRDARPLLDAPMTRRTTTMRGVTSSSHPAFVASSCPRLLRVGFGAGPRYCSMRRLFLWLLGLSLVAGVWFYWTHPDDFYEYQPPRTVLVPPPLQCLLNISKGFPEGPDGLYSSVGGSLKLGGNSPDGQTRNSARVLLIPKTSFSNAFKAVTEILVANKIKYKSTVAGKNLPDLIKISKGVGKYGVVFFEDFRSYLEMDSWNRDLLDKYCKMFKIGIVALFPPAEHNDVGPERLEDLVRKTFLPLDLNTPTDLTDLTVSANSTVLRVTRGGLTERNTIKSGSEWISFVPKHETYSAVAWATRAAEDGGATVGTQEIIVLQDHGLQDSIPKVFFGGDLYHWVNRLLFLDSLSWLSNGRIAVPLTRYILVDIDDVFVGKYRFLPEDVQALVESQERMAKMVQGFKYNLGFSGGFFHSGGDRRENLGDDAILQHKDRFWWFPHMWRHQQPHSFDNITLLVEQMELNREFAREKGIPVENNYAVAPHHSGVYPMHEQLYEAWKRIWDIKVTSSEEYPHLRPARLRHGFIHYGIKVLPRQTCGLFTKNLFYAEYPGGPEVLEESINGGELFETIAFNPVSIFMSHMPNYCMDRLGIYTIESVVRKLKCWTRFDLRTRNPKVLADIYFGMFPEEIEPVWGNPCDDHRHLEIWSKSKSCERLPHFLVIGPQKTGTTALYTFLQMHPAIKSNLPSPDTFEELQFFSGQNYQKGIDWYMDFFPPADNSSVFFEKSATYFDQELVPSRAHRLLQRAQLIAIVISPSKRAYSWYQHMKAKDDPTAMKYSFHDIITADARTPKAVRQLQARCLEPGKYASHLERWLSFYKSKQLVIIDGEELKDDPVSVMNNLQHFLDVAPFFEYSEKLAYDPKKGFFCEVLPNGKTKCLGKGKGRQYPPMKPESQKYLKTFYRLHNEALLKLMTRLGYTVPKWLEDELKDISNAAAEQLTVHANQSNLEGSDV